MVRLFDLLRRILGVLMVLPPFFIAFVLGGIWFKVCVFLAALILYYEIYRLVVNRFSVFSFIVGIVAITISFWEGGFILPFVLLLIFGLVNYIIGFSIKDALVLISVVVYILIPANIVISLREISPFITAYVLVVNWSYDTGAYLSGRFFGKKRIFQRISSGKTLEGVIGGLMASLFAGGMFGVITGDISRVLIFSLTGIYIGAFAQMGDLVESALKRERGVKDSGKILPGHGGLFDRVDSLIMSLAGFYILLNLFRKHFIF